MPVYGSSVICYFLCDICYAVPYMPAFIYHISYISCACCYIYLTVSAVTPSELAAVSHMLLYCTCQKLTLGHQGEPEQAGDNAV